MRLLPPGLVIHRMVKEAETTPLKPISDSPDGQTFQLARKEVVAVWKQMAEDAAKEGVQLKVIWGFRSKDVQLKHFKEAQEKHGKRGAVRWVAPPGYSEHQTGFALDIGDYNDTEADDNPLFERTNAFRWLKKNARRYKFEMSFPPGNWQGVGYEPWHWRYVGTEEAYKLFHPKKLSAAWCWTFSWMEALTRFING
jgi:D-alanyl-D-alanine carboxypeptidase